MVLSIISNIEVEELKFTKTLLTKTTIMRKIYKIIQRDIIAKQMFLVECKISEDTCTIKCTILQYSIAKFFLYKNSK